MSLDSRADDAAAPIATCDDASRVYERDDRGILGHWRAAEPVTVTALRDVSLTVEPGEIVGIQGPSGSGKSTLLHLLAALETPTSGTVTVAGEDTSTLSARARARLRLDTVGMVFQRFHLLAALSARANVALPLVETGMGKAQRRERATALLEQVGLGDRITHTPGRLSGGEQQRVAIARALATDPALLLADEPTGELDTETGARVLEQIAAVAGDGRAVVVASHDQATLDIADRVVTLRDGTRIDD